MLFIITYYYFFTTKMDKSNFEKVIDFNKQFGITLHEKPILNIFDIDPKLIQYRMSLVREEMRELEDGVLQKNYKETIDALGDLLYVIYGFSASIGTNMDSAFDIIHQSNMSKLCNTEEEAIKTVEFYIQNKEKLGYDSPAYRKSFDGKYFVVYNQSSCKVLKSINYKEVDFTSLLNQ